MSKLSVCIPCYKRHSLSARHIEECLKSSRVPDEIIAVNDGGDKGLDTMLAKLEWDRTKTKIIYAEVEEDILWGYNMACNLGLWLSTGDIIALEDTDHIPDRETYERGLKAFENNPEIGRVSFARRIVQVNEMSGPIEEWVSTGNMGPNQMVAMIKREDWLKLKGQDEQFCGSYGYMAYDFPYRRDKLLGIKTIKENRCNRGTIQIIMPAT